MLHLVFKVSSTCSHTRLKSLSPLSNCFINYALVNLCPIRQQSGVVDLGVKVNGQYYRDILLTRDLLPDIKQYSDYFTFQQDGTPAHRARETVELLKVETPDFIPPNLWPPTAPISTQWITHSGAYCKNGFTRQTVRMSTSYDAGLLRHGPLVERCSY